MDTATGSLQAGTSNKTFGRLENGEPIRHGAHVDTGTSFVGLRVPWFEEGRALALRAHRLLAPDGIALGWDVGLAADAPVLLEVNVWTTSYDYDPPSDAHGDACVAVLARLVAGGRKPGDGL